MRSTRLDRVLLDMNTQCDFLLPRGALPVVNRSEALPNIRKIMNWGRIHQAPVVSSLECHRIGEATRGFPPHCIEQTHGQKKLPFTMMPHRIVLHGDNTLDVPLDPFRRYQQVIFTKRRDDFLSNPKADRLINSIQTKVFIVFGAGVEYCIKSAVLGLLARKRQIIVVRDACGTWCTADNDIAFLQMQAKGALVVTTEEFLSGEAERKLCVLPIQEPDEEELPPLPLPPPEIRVHIQVRVSATPAVPASEGGNGKSQRPRKSRKKTSNDRPKEEAKQDSSTPTNGNAVGTASGTAGATNGKSKKKVLEIDDLVKIARQKLRSVRQAKSQKS